MTMEEFDRKWDIESQKTILAMAVEQGLRVLRNNTPEEDSGSLARAAQLLSKDLSDLPWAQIRYIVKRRL